MLQTNRIQTRSRFRLLELGRDGRNWVIYINVLGFDSTINHFPIN